MQFYIRSCLVELLVACALLHVSGDHVQSSQGIFSIYGKSLHQFVAESHVLNLQIRTYINSKSQ